jgi:hypothetical protein
MPSPKDYYQRMIGEPSMNLAYEFGNIVCAAEKALGNVQVLLEISVYDVKKDKERARTEQQNKYYHKLLDIICAHTGYTHRELHEELKFLFLAYPHVRGEREYWIIKSTKELTSKNFGEYLTKVFNWAGTEHGLVLPSSEDYYQ